MTRRLLCAVPVSAMVSLSTAAIALTIALGIILGVTPVLGSTMLLCTPAAIVLRLNLRCVDVRRGWFDKFAPRGRGIDPGGCGAGGPDSVGGHHARTAGMAGVGHGGFRPPLCNARSFGASMVEEGPAKRDFILWPLKA